MSETKNIFIDLKSYVDLTLKKFNELFELIDLENFSTAIKLELKQQISHIDSISITKSNNPYQVLNFWNGVAISIKNIINLFKNQKNPEQVELALNELLKISENISDISKNSKLSDSDIKNQFEEYQEISNDESYKDINIKNEENKRTETSFRVFERLIDEQKIKVDSVISSSLEKIDQTNKKLEEFRTYLESETPSLKAKLETTNNFFANVGGAKLAEHYYNQSIAEKRLADRFRIIFIVSFLIIFLSISIPSILNLFQITDDLNPNSNIKFTLAYIPVLLLFSAGSTYLIKESNKHRLRQNILNDKYLALSTIDLYLSTVESKDINEIKIKLSEYFFSSQRAAENSKDGFPIDPQETINRLIDAVSKIKK